MPKTIYGDILKRLSHKNVNFVVDATGDLLLESLKYKPFLVKPNNFELGDIFGINIATDDYDSVIKYAKVLKDKGYSDIDIEDLEYERVQELLDKATTLDEILTIEKKLSDLRKKTAKDFSHKVCAEVLMTLML